MSNEVLAKLLRTIKNNSDVSSIMQLGIRYSQIAILIEDAIKFGYVTNNGSKLAITQNGESFLEKYNQENHFKGAERWLSTRKEYMVTPIDKYDIILPKRI